MTPTTEPVWCWCRDCEAWIGSQPLLLPPRWSNRNAQGLHRYGQPTHRTELLSLRALLARMESAA